MSNFVYRLKTLFKDAGLSTVSGQQLLGISKTQLGRYLSGYYVPSLKNALTICKHFDCSLDYLLGISDIKNQFENIKEPDFETFKSRYLNLIEEHKTSIYQIAKELHFNRNDWTYWNKNKSLPTLETLYNIAIKFQVSADYLIGRTDTK